MPAPKDSIKKQIWLSNLSRSHKYKTPWNKGRRMSDGFCEKMKALSEAEINSTPENCINLVKNFILNNSNEKYF